MKERLAHIDGLRAIAVLAVVAYHAGSDAGATPASFAGWALQNGAHGVDLFFVLSGFCLSYPTLKQLYETGSAKFDVGRFAVNRIVRIVPPYWFAIVALAIGFAIGGAHVSLPSLVRQAMFWDGDGTYLNRSFWTLPLEMRWYFIFPLALLVWIRSPKAFIPITLLAILASQTKLHSVDALMLPAFLLGIVAASVSVTGHRLARYAPYALLVLVPLSAFAMTPEAKLGQNFEPLWFVTSFVLVIAAGESPMLKRILSLRFLASVGVVSYSIYLVHDTLISWFLDRNAPVVVAAIGSIAGGAMFWALFERPFTQGNLQRRLKDELAAFIPRWLNACGVPTTFGATATVQKRTVQAEAGLARTLPAGLRATQESARL